MKQNDKVSNLQRLLMFCSLL